MRSFQKHPRRSSGIRFSLSVLLMASLTACGANENLYNGSGGGGTAAGALSIAQTDIAHGNYSGAISVLSPYCPANACVNTDIANAFSNAFLAMGNNSTVSGGSSSGSTGGGATTTTILSAIANTVSTTSPTNSQIMQALDTAIPCLANNTCTLTYLDNLATALGVLSNGGCSGGSCPDSLASTALILTAVYTLVVAQFDTGIIYTAGVWEACPVGGGGTSGCTSLSQTTLSNELQADTARVANLCELLGGSSCGTPGFTFTPPSILGTITSVANSLPSGSQSITDAVNLLLYAINGTSCPANPCSTPPSSVSVTSSTLSAYLASL